MRRLGSHVRAPTFSALLVTLLCITRSRECNTDVAPPSLSQVQPVANCQVRAFDEANSTLRKCLKFARIRTPGSARPRRRSHYAKSSRTFSARFCWRPARAHRLLLVRQRCKSPPPRTNSACPQARPGYSPRGPPPAVHTGSPAFLYAGSVSADAASGRPPSRQISRAYSATVRSLEK
jgi:hypothetical protein